MVSPYLMRPVRSLEEVERQHAEAKASQIAVGPLARIGEVQRFPPRIVSRERGTAAQSGFAQPR